MAAHDFPHAPPDAIATHRAAQCLLDAESEAAVRQLVRAKKNGEVGIRAALPGPVYGVKLSAPHQPRLARKIQATRAIRERADDGPSCGLPQAPCGPLRSSCANGHRASWRDGACAHH